MSSRNSTMNEASRTGCSNRAQPPYATWSKVSANQEPVQETSCCTVLSVPISEAESVLSRNSLPRRPWKRWRRWWGGCGGGGGCFLNPGVRKTRLHRFWSSVRYCNDSQIRTRNQPLVTGERFSADEAFDHVELGRDQA